MSDARAAATEFRRRWDAGPMTSDLGTVAAISVAGLALHVAGLADDTSFLSSAPLVIRAPGLPPPA